METTICNTSDRLLSSSTCLDSFRQERAERENEDCEVQVLTFRASALSGRSDCSQHAIATRLQKVEKGARTQEAKREASSKFAPCYNPSLLPLTHTTTLQHTLLPQQSPLQPTKSPVSKSYQMFPMQPYSGRGGWLMVRIGMFYSKECLTYAGLSFDLAVTVTIPMSRMANTWYKLPLAFASLSLPNVIMPCQSQSETCIRNSGSQPGITDTKTAPLISFFISDFTLSLLSPGYLMINAAQQPGIATEVVTLHTHATAPNSE